MADLQIASHRDRLKTLGLGSCVGVVIYDPVHKLGGMAHIMLPSSELAKGAVHNQAKYVDTAIPELMRLLIQSGAQRRNLISKLAGGAQMFALSSGQDQLRIGQRNVEASIITLQNLSIPIIAQQTGGTQGRTIELDCETGDLYLWTVNRECQVL